MQPTDLTLVHNNPFASLTLIAAPAILTNASTLLILSTSNRLARAVDRARVLADKLERLDASGEEAEEMMLNELHSAEDRTLILAKALRSIYFTVGAFASAAFISLIGAVSSGVQGVMLQVIEGVAIAVGASAVGGLVYASALLVKETRIAVAVLHEEATYIKKKVQGRLKASKSSSKG